MKERTVDRVIVGLSLTLVVLVAIELLFVPHDHAVFPWQRLPGYAALIGLIGCILVVKLSKALGARLLQRPEVDD